MAKQLTLFGEELTIDFNLAVEITFEEITGVPFDFDNLKTVKNTVALYYAAILTNNPDTKITLDGIVKNATATEIGMLREAVFGSLNEWCKPLGKQEEVEDDGDGKKKD